MTDNKGSAIELEKQTLKFVTKTIRLFPRPSDTYEGFAIRERITKLGF